MRDDKNHFEMLIEWMGHHMWMVILCWATVILGYSQCSVAETYQWSKGYTANCTDTIARVGYDPNDPATAHLLLDPINVPGDAIDKVGYFVIDNPDADVSNPVIEITMVGGCQPVHVNTKVLTPGVTYYKHAMTLLVDETFSDISPEVKSFDVTKAKPKWPDVQ